MGSCLSKKSTNTSPPSALSNPQEQQTKAVNQAEKKKVQEETVKKEIFVIKHRKSHEVERRCEDENCGEGKKAEEGDEREKNNGGGGVVGGGAPVRTSSCTKEEVDAILIQCGRLSRSSSTGKAGISDGNGSSQRGGGKRYSGSKRSFDFDNENSKGDGGSEDNVVDGGDDEGVVGERVHRHRQRHRQSRTPTSSSQGRRRTPSRERDQGQQQQQRSGSRERGTNGSGRRVSRSPGRRSESPITTSSSNGAATNSSANANSNSNASRPQKMVSVPATVSSLAMDKSNNAGGEPISAAAIKRIQVKRNVGGGGGDASAGTRTAASPRARSPARTNARVSNENQQQPMSLSRSNSRKAEHSPYRRNPLSEIDTNVVIEQRPATGSKAANNVLSQASALKINADNVTNNKVVAHSADNKISNSKAMEQHKLIAEEGRGVQGTNGNVAVNVVSAGPHGVTRSRSKRLSRDLDTNPEALADPTPSFTALLLEDIHNFHQKSTPPAFSLPACVTKACSILEAVADLNSSTGSNLSSAFSESRKRNPTAEQITRKDENYSFGANPAGMKRLETKEPFVESEVVVTDDLMEPSFHKYVTVRRGTTGGGGDMDEQESSGSNSFVGSQQHWVSSSSWEPNSADSTDRWTSSRSTKEDDCSPLGFQRHAISETGREADETRRTTVVKRRDSDQQQNGIGRGRIGSRGGLHTMPTAAAAAASS